MANEEVMINTPEGIRAYLAGIKLPGLRVIRGSNGGMKMAVKLEGAQRGGGAAGDEKAIAVSAKGEQFVAAGAAPYAEIARQGGGYSVMATVAVAGLVVRPGTVAAITLWNGEGTGGKSYVIDRLFTHNLVSTSAKSLFSIWACVHPTGMAKPTADIPASAVNLVGNSGKKYNGMAVVDVGATVVDNGWYPWATSTEGTTVTTLPGGHLTAEVAGRLIVPPQGALSLHVVSSIVGYTFCTGASWYEAQLDLE